MHQRSAPTTADLNVCGHVNYTLGPTVPPTITIANARETLRLLTLASDPTLHGEIPDLRRAIDRHDEAVL